MQRVRRAEVGIEVTAPTHCRKKPGFGCPFQNEAMWVLSFVFLKGPSLYWLGGTFAVLAHIHSLVHLYNHLINI